MKRLKKLMVFLSTGTMAVVLAACYGVPVDEMYDSLIRVKDDNGNPIKGLKVSLVTEASDSLTDLTNENGEAVFGVFEAEPIKSIVVEDIDGADNGGEFRKTEITFVKSDTIDITLARMTK